VEDLQGRVAVVTGAASGLGLAMSYRFAQAQMKVVLADIEADPLDAAVRELRAAGHDATGVFIHDLNLAVAHQRQQPGDSEHHDDHDPAHGTAPHAAKAKRST